MIIKKRGDPYKIYKKTKTWKVVAQAIKGLIKNRDLILQTHPDHVIGYLTKCLVNVKKRRINLKKIILKSLLDDDERFESIYHFVNKRDYINRNIDCTPLYTDLDTIRRDNDAYKPKEVFSCIKELIDERYIECLKTDESKARPKVVKDPNYNFREFSRYWLRLIKPK